MELKGLRLMITGAATAEEARAGAQAKLATSIFFQDYVIFEVEQDGKNFIIWAKREA